MIDMRLFKITVFTCLLFAMGFGVFAQPHFKSQEVSDEDGIPVLIKHLPDWESVRDRTTFTQNAEELRSVVGSHSVLDAIDFKGGTEAVTAPYPAGRLLIVEYTNPQASADADAKFIQRLAESPDSSRIVYRRIGNYNAFVFDVADPDAANELLDQIKYQKVVQWLGEDPYLLKRIEKYFVTTTRDIFISTVLWIVSGIGLSVIAGIVVGFLFFRFRERKRATRTAYSDAGGLTRLNLDGLSE